jgi:uncharacterized protein YjiK
LLIEGNVRARLVLTASLVMTACMSPGASETVSGTDDALVTASVGTVGSVRLPIKEVSGLGHVRVSGQTKYLAVGDSTPSIVTFTIGSGGRISQVETHDLANLFGNGPSQWEGVAGDGAGHVFVLSEAANTITVLDPTLRRIVHTIAFSVPEADPLAQAWKADKNSRAEGFVLLANGHVLVAKEKHPAALVELGPEGSAPEGYRPDLALGDRAFPLPAGSANKLVALKHWLVKDRDARILTDISDLALDEENRLLLLSDQGRAIARIERQLDPSEAKIDIKAIFALPSTVSKPEGLTFGQGRPFVATDGKDVSKDALYELEALPR